MGIPIADFRTNYLSDFQPKALCVFAALLSQVHVIVDSEDFCHLLGTDTAAVIYHADFQEILHRICLQPLKKDRDPSLLLFHAGKCILDQIKEHLHNPREIVVEFLWADIGGVGLKV